MDGGLDGIAQGIDAINLVANAPVGGPYTLVGWKMKEADYRYNMERYLGMLDPNQRLSFAPLDKLIKNSLDGCDLHVLAFKNVNQIDNSNPNMMQGLVIFNQDSNSFKI